MYLPKLCLKLQFLRPSHRLLYLFCPQSVSVPRSSFRDIKWNKKDRHEALCTNSVITEPYKFIWRNSSILYDTWTLPEKISKHLLWHFKRKLARNDTILPPLDIVTCNSANKQSFQNLTKGHFAMLHRCKKDDLLVELLAWTSRGCNLLLFLPHT